MGLCKCPKRLVTNQFCFEHCVNVCEFCMVRQHKKCIVQSYLQWLKDSDYDSTCKFCSKPLQSDEKGVDCVRLVCYHVFHWDCLNQYQNSLPTSTAPSGRKCVICAEPIIPASNLASPVSETLRNKLSQINWGRNDLGLPLLYENQKSDAMVNEINKNIDSVPQSRNSAFIVGSESPPKPEISHSILNMHGDYGSNKRLLTRESPIGSADRDENKYKRRTPREIFSRWSRRFYKPTSRPFYRKTWFHIVTAITVFVLFLYLLASYGRESTKDNPMLKMEMNPNLQFHEN